jgi:hypothetical protein
MYRVPTCITPVIVMGYMYVYVCTLDTFLHEFTLMCDLTCTVPQIILCFFIDNDFIFIYVHV